MTGTFRFQQDRVSVVSSDLRSEDENKNEDLKFKDKDPRTGHLEPQIGVAS